jgi:ribosomal protein L7/L12
MPVDSSGIRAPIGKSLPIFCWVIVLDGDGVWAMQRLVSIVILVLFLLIALLGRRLISVEKRLAKLIAIDAKLDLLLKAARLEYDPLGNLPGDVAKALQAGQKIDAIKRYREVMSVSLAEAKDVIEEAQRRAGL